MRYLFETFQSPTTIARATATGECITLPEPSQVRSVGPAPGPTDQLFRGIREGQPRFLQLGVVVFGCPSFESGKFCHVNMLMYLFACIYVSMYPHIYESL